MRRVCAGERRPSVAKEIGRPMGRGRAYKNGKQTQLKYTHVSEPAVDVLAGLTEILKTATAWRKYC